ncbi:MAG: recombinase family protein, partial [Clostridiales bacterium]|nr:recombinase family protein [Clostridiales bacterium]
ADKKTWQVSTVRSILRNEKYKGDALLQKKFTEDFLTKKLRVNKGEVPQFYVEGSHPAIIEPDEFDAVQAELERRGELGRPMGCGSPFSAKIVCGDCNGWYGPKVWGSNTKYRKIVWQCNDKYQGDHRCRTTHVTEAQIKERFLAAWNSMAAYREELIADCRAAKAVLCDCVAIDTELAELSREIEVVTDLSRKAIHEIAHNAADQEGLNERNNGYLERHRKATERKAALEGAKRRRKSRARILETFLCGIATSPQVLTEFDEKLWTATIDRVTVMLDDRLVFRFKDGSEVTG